MPDEHDKTIRLEAVDLKKLFAGKPISSDGPRCRMVA
jgi:hypothetical protein